MTAFGGFLGNDLYRQGLPFINEMFKMCGLTVFGNQSQTSKVSYRCVIHASCSIDLVLMIIEIISNHDQDVSSV